MTLVLALILAARRALGLPRARRLRPRGDSLDLPESEAMVAESVDSTRDHAGGSLWHRPSAQLDYRLTASYVHTSRDTYYGSGMDPNAYGSSRNPLWVLDGQVNRYGRSRILSAGVQWTSDHLEDVQPAYERFTDDTHRNPGAYVQDDCRSPAACSSSTGCARTSTTPSRTS